MFDPDITRRLPPGSQYYQGIAVRKLVLPSLARFGLYQISWYYKNWWAVRLRTGARLSPIWRSLFFWLFAYALFRRIRQSADEQGVITAFSPSLAALTSAVFALFWRLDETFWFTTILTIVPLVLVQQVINRVNAMVAPDAPIDQELTWWERITVPLGSLGFILAVFGTAVMAF